MTDSSLTDGFPDTRPGRYGLAASEIDAGTRSAFAAWNRARRRLARLEDRFSASTRCENAREPLSLEQINELNVLRTEVRTLWEIASRENSAPAPAPAARAGSPWWKRLWPGGPLGL